MIIIRRPLQRVARARANKRLSFAAKAKKTKNMKIPTQQFKKMPKNNKNDNSQFQKNLVEIIFFSHAKPRQAKPSRGLIGQAYSQFCCFFPLIDDHPITFHLSKYISIHFRRFLFSFSNAHKKRRCDGDRKKTGHSW